MEGRDGRKEGSGGGGGGGVLRYDLLGTRNSGFSMSQSNKDACYPAGTCGKSGVKKSEIKMSLSEGRGRVKLKCLFF